MIRITKILIAYLTITFACSQANASAGRVSDSALRSTPSKVEDKSRIEPSSLSSQQIANNMITNSDTIVIAEYTGAYKTRLKRFSTQESAHLFQFKVMQSIKGNANGNIGVSVSNKDIQPTLAKDFYKSGGRYLLILSSQSSHRYKSLSEEQDPPVWYVFLNPNFAILLD